MTARAATRITSAGSGWPALAAGVIAQAVDDARDARPGAYEWLERDGRHWLYLITPATIDPEALHQRLLASCAPRRRPVRAPRTNARPFGSALRRIRVRQGATQAGIARAAGASTSLICRLEAGARRPTLDLVLAIVTALGCSAVERSQLLAAAGLDST